MKFRTLMANEIECRVATVTEKGCSLLLYKDARADMNLLDETVGAENWQRKHELINGNLFCSVGIYISDRKEWIWKQDVGTESYTEKEKGQASDSFKRACVNLGIGRELYTAPFVWINAGDVNITEKNGKKTTYDRFTVKDISYDENRCIKSLRIVNSKTNKVVFSMGAQIAPVDTETQEKKDNISYAETKAKVLKYINNNCKEESKAQIAKYYKVDDVTKMNMQQCKHYLAQLEKKGITA